MPLCTELFKAHLITCRDCIIYLALAVRKNAKARSCMGQRNISSAA
jgi:hypothetical protein